MAERKPILPKKDIPAEAQEKALEQLQRQDKKKNVQRITVDFPQFLYDKMKSEIEDTGQTMKGFIVGLVRDHFTRKERQ
jgi:hypothetical protein